MYILYIYMRSELFLFWIRYELVPARRITFYLRAFKNEYAESYPRDRIKRGEHIGEAYFGVWAVVREIWSLFVLLGKPLLQGVELSILKSTEQIFRPYIGYYLEPFDTERIDMIVSTTGRRQWHLFCSASREGLLHETPAKVLRQCIELLGGLRGKITLQPNQFCTLVLESCETNLVKVVRMTSRKNALVVFFEKKYCELFKLL